MNKSKMRRKVKYNQLKISKLYSMQLKTKKMKVG